MSEYSESDSSICQYPSQVTEEGAEEGDYHTSLADRLARCFRLCSMLGVCGIQNYGWYASTAAGLFGELFFLSV